MGHEVSGDGISPKKKLINAIEGAPIPNTKDDVRSFLGLVEFYSKFVPNLASKTYNLRQLLKLKQDFHWNAELQSDFDTIKQDLVSAFPLQAFDCMAPFIITMEASGKGLGAVLSQVVGDNEMTIGFASRSLTPSEEKFSVIEREMLATVWAMEKFQQFIWGTRFTLRTDRKPLLKILTPEGILKATPRLARMSLKLLEFNYDVEYLPGKRNLIGEYLSRSPLLIHDATYAECNDFNVAIVHDHCNVVTHAILKEEWDKGCNNDKNLM